MGERRTADPATSGPQSITFLYGEEEFTVSGFENDLPELSSVTDRGSLVKAGLNSPGATLDVDSWHAVARAVVAPDSAAAQLRAQKGLLSALIEEHVEGATLRSLHTRAWLTELFPGLQPRTGQEALPVDDPVVLGDLGHDGEPLACVVYTYRDIAHLRAHLRQTITETRRANPNPYDQSILARRITRAVIAHPARLEFEDGTEPVDILVVRDGITRLTSAWALLTGEESPTPDQIARTAGDLLLAEKPQRRGAEKPRSQRMALGRRDALAELRAEFYQGLGGGQPADRSVRLGQTLVVPAQITVGLRRHGTTTLPAEEVFDDAVRSILASLHVEFKAWESAAQNVEVGSRALRRVHLNGQSETRLLEGVVALALGRRRPEELPEVFGDRRIPGTPLWRAVYLVHHLTRDDVFREVKRHAKDIKGTRQMKTAGYAELLGPIIDLPWRGAKSASLKQARNAWANGGVLTKAVLGHWTPIPCDDFTHLVPAAHEGDTDARQTLTVAGGTALLADKLITRNVGSAVGNTVPWRSNVDQVVAGLAESHEGLWMLAVAANAFDADRECVNSFSATQLLGKDKTEMYTIPDVDPEHPDRLRKDQGGVASLALTPWRVVEASDPVRAQALDEEKDRASEDTMTVGEVLDQKRRDLVVAVEAARQRLDALLDYAKTPEAKQTTLEPFGSHPEWKTLDDEVRDLATIIYHHRPDQADEDDEEYDDTEEDWA
ncbi:hypothetical protein [Streptomyces sp. WAC06614]|uniref:hypothetical protein n=1 Tax=Streptomyces sp. WAC06614 TaxID=2487416 RepID=UPI000F796F89|nr:hypothetical protein [Streptomyces sp. WAC06614]RSS66783.1 hypothetical protein EF918_29000 [Streptomyces sp. WAC06614]